MVVGNEEQDVAMRGGCGPDRAGKGRRGRGAGRADQKRTPVQ